MFPFLHMNVGRVNGCVILFPQLFYLSQLSPQETEKRISVGLSSLLFAVAPPPTHCPLTSLCVPVPSSARLQYLSTGEESVFVSQSDCAIIAKGFDFPLTNAISGQWRGARKNVCEPGLRELARDVHMLLMETFTFWGCLFPVSVRWHLVKVSASRIGPGIDTIP